MPLAYHTLGGWKSSGFGDLNQHGPDWVRLYTKTKTVTSRWPWHEDADFTIRRRSEKLGASWGGTRSLIAPMIGLGDRQNAFWSASECILRFSIGLEDEEDLLTDINRLLKNLADDLERNRRHPHSQTCYEIMPDHRLSWISFAQKANESASIG